MLTVMRKRTDALTPYGKPAILEEYGGSWKGGDQGAMAQELHDGLWAGWMLPLAGSPMAWWWNFIFAKDLDRFHAVFADYVRGEDLRGHDDRFVRLQIPASGMSAMARIGSERAYAWICHEGISNSNNGSRGHLDAAFRRFAKPEYDPVDDIAPDIFSPEKDLVLSLPGMKDGRYRVEFWDTWRGGPPEVCDVSCVNGVLAVPLPSMTRDMALKAKRMPPAE
jgi:hypothetical protein